MTKYIVSVFKIDRAYGGPEEGGWWYDCGELVRTIRIFSNYDHALKFYRRLNERLDATLNVGRRSIGSVLSEGKYRAMIDEDVVPRYYPESRPHYE